MPSPASFIPDVFFDEPQTHLQPPLELAHMLYVYRFCHSFTRHPHIPNSLGWIFLLLTAVSVVSKFIWAAFGTVLAFHLLSNGTLSS